MVIFVVDDEEIILEGEVRTVRRCAPDADVRGFSSPAAALNCLREQGADVVFLDLEMPEIHGMELAGQMKALCPQLNIIFATSYPQYAHTAIRLRASGYLLKPLREEEIMEELDNLRYRVRKGKSGLFVRCFGNFEVFYNGRPVIFRYTRTKELFAYLIDRCGAMVSKDELITALWGGDTNKTNYFKQLQKDLHDTLQSLGEERVLICQRGYLALLMDQVACDYYEWLEGTPPGANAFRGEYMRQYDWAEATWLNMTTGGQLPYDFS